MVDAVGTGALLAADSGPELPTVNDFLPPEILFQGTPFAINRIILIRIVATVVLLVVLGITAKRAKLIPGRWQGAGEFPHLFAFCMIPEPSGATGSDTEIVERFVKRLSLCLH